MNWIHFALVTYIFGLSVILLLIAHRLFQRPAAAGQMGSGTDYALLERVARLTQENEALRELNSHGCDAEAATSAEIAAPAEITAPDEPAAPAEMSADATEAPAWNEAMAGVLRAAGSQPAHAEKPPANAKPSIRPARKPSAIHLSRASDESVARLAISPGCLRATAGTEGRRPDAEQMASPAGGPDTEPESVKAVRSLIHAGLDDETIAGRLRLSLAEIGLIRRLPAPVSNAAEKRAQEITKTFDNMNKGPESAASLPTAGNRR